MRSIAPHRKLPSRAVAAGLASALVLAACGGSADVDALADLQTEGDQVALAATGTMPAPITTASNPDTGDQSTSDNTAREGTGSDAPNLPATSAPVEATQASRPSDEPSTSSALSTTATTTGATVTTAAVTAPETTATSTTRPPATTQAPTTQPPSTSTPAPADLPDITVVDIASGSSINFRQAAQTNGLPVVLWFWSPT